jgi:hypothetical protein
VNPTGAVFQPELIVLIKYIFDDVTAMLPEAKRTPTMKVEIASKIFECVAKGERIQPRSKLRLFWRWQV